MITLDSRGKSEIGMQFWGSVLGLFWNSDFSLAILHSSWNRDSFTDKSITLDSGEVNTFTAFFKNFADQIPAVLLIFKQDLRIRWITNSLP